ncbi:MAG: hypothetical protein ACOYMA_00370 [Bacteroidia bacterium]
MGKKKGVVKKAGNARDIKIDNSTSTNNLEYLLGYYNLFTDKESQQRRESVQTILDNRLTAAQFFTPEVDAMMGKGSEAAKAEIAAIQKNQQRQQSKNYTNLKEYNATATKANSRLNLGKYFNAIQKGQQLVQQYNNGYILPNIGDTTPRDIAKGNKALTDMKTVLGILSDFAEDTGILSNPNDPEVSKYVGLINNLHNSNNRQAKLDMAYSGLADDLVQAQDYLSQNSPNVNSTTSP